MDGRVEFYARALRCHYGYMWVEATVVDDIDVDGWKRPTPRTDVVLIRCPAADNHEPTRNELYDPFERETGLFRILAQTPVTRDATVNFANSYGQLYMHGAGVRFEHNGVKIGTFGDPSMGWRYNIFALRHWVRVWDFIAGNDSRGLTDYLRWLPKWANEEHKRSFSHPIDYYVRDSRPLLDLEPKKRIAAARTLLAEGVWRSPLSDSLTFHLVHDEPSGLIRLRLRCENLAAAIWAQFVSAIVENKQFRQCEFCAKPFELSPDLHRTNRYYCTTSCRLKAYRRRQKDAVKLHKQGKKLKQIADALESDIPTVKGWIAAAKEKENDSTGRDEDT